MVASALGLEAVLLADGVIGFRQGIDAALLLRRQLLVEPAAAVHAQCLQPGLLAGGVVACTQGIEWRENGAFTSVCASSIPEARDPRLALPRLWQLTLACRWRTPIALTLPRLVFSLRR